MTGNSPLRKLLERKGISQAALAAKLKATPSQVSRWCSGRRSISHRSASKIAAALNVRPEEIFSRAKVAWKGEVIAEDGTGIDLPEKRRARWVSKERLMALFDPPLSSIQLLRLKNAGKIRPYGFGRRIVYDTLEIAALLQPLFRK